MSLTSTIKTVSDFLDEIDEIMTENKFILDYITSISDSVKELGIEFSETENSKFNWMLNLHLKNFSERVIPQIESILSFPFVLNENETTPTIEFLGYVVYEGFKIPTAIELTLKRNPKFFLCHFLRVSCTDTDYDFMKWFINKFNLDFSNEIECIDCDNVNGIYFLFKIYGNIPIVQKYIELKRDYIVSRLRKTHMIANIGFLDCDFFTKEDRLSVVNHIECISSIRTVISLRCWNEIKCYFNMKRNKGVYYFSILSTSLRILHEEECLLVDETLSYFEDRKMMSIISKIISFYPEEKKDKIKKFIYEEYANFFENTSLLYLVLRNVSQHTKYLGLRF